MRAFRWLAIILAVVVVIVGGAIAWLTFAFDPDDYREQVVRVVKERTGRDLVIGAPISLTFLPRLGISLRDVTMKNAAGFPDEPFAHLDELTVRVDLVPLLDSQLVVDTVVLEGTTLNLHRLEDGRENWSDLLNPGGAQLPPELAGQERGTLPQELGRGDLESLPPEAREAAESALTSRWISGYAVQGIQLRNAEVRWQDDRSGTRIEVHDLQLDTGSIAPGKAVPVTAELAFRDEKSMNAGALTLSGHVALGADANWISVPEMTMGAEIQGPSIPGGALEAVLFAALALDQAAGTLSVSEIALEGPGGLEIKGKADASIAGDFPFRGELTLAAAPRQFLQAMDIDLATRDPGVLKQLDGQLSFAGNAAHLNVDKIEFVLDDTRVNGNVRADFANDLALDFSLHMDALDVDRYLSPEEDAKAQAASGAAPGEGKQEGQGSAFPVLPGARGDVTLDRLTVSGLTLSGIKVRVHSSAEGLRLDPMSANLYQGTYNGSLKLQPGKRAPRWAVSEKVKGVQIGPLLKDLTGEDRLEGTGHVSADLSGVGLDEAAIRRTMKGDASFEFRDGALKGINLAQVLREIKARLRGQHAAETTVQQTDFSVLSASLKIGNGVVKNDDLAMKTPFLRVSGKGEANLVTEDLDYRMTAKVVGSATGQGGREFAELEGIPVTVRVGGTLAEPVYTPDYEATIKAIAGKRIDEERGKLEDRARDEIQKALKGLF
jgi:AsmA protein